MKRILFLLPFVALLCWWVLAQQPRHRFVSAGKKAQPAAPFPDTLIPSKASPPMGIASFLAGGFHTALNLPATDSLLLRSLRKDKSGGQHALTQQSHHGIPIFGAWYNIHQKDGKLTSFGGNVFHGIRVNVDTVLSKAEAREKALAALPAGRYAWQDAQWEAALRRQKGDTMATFFPKGELLILPPEELLEKPENYNPEQALAGKYAYRLAWSFEITAIEPEIQKEQIFIDARDGRVLHRLPQMAYCATPAQGKAAYQPNLVEITTDSCTGAATLKYRLYDPLRKIEIFDGGNTTGTPLIGFFNDGLIWAPPQADTAAIAAMHGLRLWYDYMAERFGWYGLTGDPARPILAWVHHQQDFENAIYSGFLLFGDGNPDGWLKSPLVARDIVFHEASHGLTEHTAGLLYVSEAGIINEAIADIFACLIELEHGGNWTMGEDVLPGGTRRLDNPKMMGLPDTYQGEYWAHQSAPNQALHHNSTVFSHWFYLLAEGGQGTNDQGTAYALNGVGRNKAAELLFHSMQYHFLNPNDGFYGARRASINAASNLNWSQEDIDELAMAWCAVAVGGCEAQGSESITVLSPNGGEVYYPGDPILLQWENTQGVRNLKLIFTSNDFASAQVLESFTVFSTGGNRTVVAPTVNSRLCRIRLLAEEDPLAFDDSDSTFAIIGCGLLSSFSVIPESACPGIGFTVDNTSHGEDIDFTWLLDEQPYPAPAGGFTLSTLEPGRHTIALLADNGLCVDTFRRTIHVAPIASAEYFFSISNRLVSAAPVFNQGSQYTWSVDGQEVQRSAGPQSLSWTAPDTGAFELCLFVEDDCAGTVEYCQLVQITEEEACLGSEGSWEQYINLERDASIIRELGDTLIIGGEWGLVFFNKNDGSHTLINGINSNLPSVPVQDIVVDSFRNAVWVAAWPEGLWKMNTLTFEDTLINAFTPGYQLPSNGVRALALSDNGTLYVGTWNSANPSNLSKGFSEYPLHGAPSNFTTMDGLPWNAITALHAWGDSLLIGTSRGLALKVGPEIHIADTLEEVRIEKITRNNDGIWVEIFGNDLYLLNDSLEIKNIYNSENSNLTSGVELFYASEEAAYLSNYGLTIASAPPPFERWNTENSNLPNNRISALFVGSDGQVWLTIDGRPSLHRFLENGIFQSYDLAPDYRGHNTITAIYSDPYSGEIIIGGDDQGTLGIRTENGSWSHIDFGDYGNHGHAGFTAFARDANGTTYIGTDSWTTRLIVIQPNGTVQIYDYNDTPIEDEITCALYHEGSVFFGTSGQGVFRLENGQFTQYSRANTPEIPENRINDIILGPNGHLWIGLGANNLAENPEGVVEFDPQTETWALHQIDVNVADGTYDLAFDSCGNIWMRVSHTYGYLNSRSFLYRYNTADSQWDNMTSANAALDVGPWGDITADLYGNIWASSVEVGLLKLDCEGNILEQYNKENSGLLSDNINVIEIDRNGGLWLGTNVGTVHFTPSSQTLQPSYTQAGEPCIKQPATFTNTTTGADAWEWRVNDSLVSEDRNFEYIFPEPGEYIVELTAFNAEDCSTSTSQAVTVHPVVDFYGFAENIIECTASQILRAPEGMAAYEWKRGSFTVSTEPFLQVEQSNSGNYELIITDYCGLEKSIDITVTLSGACVRPGDLNNDGIVDYRDLLWLGFTFGYSGSERQEQGILWQEYPALDWNGSLPGGTNLKYCDCDGNGFVDLADWEAIDLNYRNVHAAPPPLPPMAPSPYSFVPVLVEVDTSSYEGRYLLSFDIVAQSADGSPIDNFYGAGMRMYFVLPPGVELAEAPLFSFNGSTLGTEGVNAIGLVKAFVDEGFMDVAYTRLDHRNKAGVGRIGNATFLVTDDHLPILDSLWFSLNITGSTAMTSEGGFIPINGGERSYAFSGGEIVSAEGLTKENQVNIYPNPTSGICRLELPNSPAREVAIQVLNTHGTEVWATVSTGQALSQEMDLSGLPAGLYFVVITTGEQRLARRIIKL